MTRIKAGMKRINLNKILIFSDLLHPACILFIRVPLSRMFTAFKK